MNYELKQFLKKFFGSRLFVLAAVISLFFLMVLIRVFSLQIVNGKEYQKNFTLLIQKTLSIDAARGNIYDCNGNLLAYNERAYSVVISDNGSYNNTSVKNEELNAELAEIISVIRKNGENIYNDFAIKLNDDGKYEYSVSGTSLNRFLADVFGEVSYDKLEYNKKFDFDEWNVLPEYVYDGDDILEKVITEYFISNNYHYEMKACVAIPAFCIFKSEVDESDDDICKVYGNFWMFVYEKDGTTLECISGAENPGVIYLKKNGDSYVVDHFDQPGGIKRFSNGNKSLEDQYYSSTNAMKDPVLTKRAWYIKNYVEMFRLNIDSYHDSDWDKVLLSDFEFSGKEE